MRHIVLSKAGIKKVSWPTRVWWTIERFFTRIGLFNRAVTDLDKFLVRFHNGYFGGRELYDSDMTLPASKLEKYFNNDPESFILSKKLILNLLKQYWQHDARKEFLDKKRASTGNQSLTIENYPPYTFKEALEQVYLNVTGLAKSAERSDAYADALRKQGIYKEVMALAANRTAFKEVVNNLFPGVLTKDIYGFEVELADEDLEIVNISQEIQDKELIDEVKNSLYTVKQLLGTISYVDEDTGVTSFIPFGHVFHIVAEILQSFNSQLGLDELFSSSTNWADLAFAKYPGTNKMKAIREFLSNLIYSAYSKDFARYIDFFNESTIYISTSKQDIVDESFGDLTKKAKNKQDIVKVTKQDNESHADFLNRIMESLPEGFITKQNLYEQLRLFRARNLYAQLFSSIGSLRYQDPMIGTREKESDKRYSYRYFKGREGGTKSVLYSNFSQGIIHRYYTSSYVTNNDGDVVEHLSRDEGMVFSYQERRRLTEAPPQDLKGPELNRWKANRVVEFLRMIGITNIRNLIISNNPARDSEIPILYEDMVKFVDRIHQEVQKERGSIEELVQVKERKFLSRIVSRITPLNNLYQPTNFIRGDGKRTYKWIQGSWITDVFKHIVGKASSPVRFLAGLSLENYSHLKSEFFKWNIFVSSKENVHDAINTIYEMVDHDSIKYKGLSGSARVVRNESPFDWVSRHFNYGFIGYLSQRTQGKATYVQYADTISNKPRAIGAVINVLNEKELLSAIESMIKQQLNRPKDLKIKNYDPKKNFIFGLEWDGRESLSDSAIKRKAKEVYQAITKEADNTLAALMNENVLMASNIDDVYSALYNSGVLDNIEGDLRNQAVNIALNKVIDFETAIAKLNPETDQLEYEEVPLTEEQIQERQEKMEQLIEQANNSMSIKDKEALIAYYAPLFRTFFLNNYVNSHQLRQLILGDTAFYKSGKEFYDVIKRISIAFGAGKKFIVNEALGFLPEKAKVVVVQDDKKYVDEVIGLAKELYGTSFDATDGISFITPKYWKKMRKSAGIEAELDVSLKPVYFNIDEQGVPRALKFATIVLTDELVEAFPHLGK